jgi:hypothetical protein
VLLVQFAMIALQYAEQLTPPVSPASPVRLAPLLFDELLQPAIVNAARATPDTNLSVRKKVF